MTNAIQIEMTDFDNLEANPKFWAWSSTKYKSIAEFANEHNAQSDDNDYICKEQIKFLALGMEIPTTKWVFRIKRIK